MIPHLVYYQLVIFVLLWLCIMLSHLWPSLPSGIPKRPANPAGCLLVKDAVAVAHYLASLACAQCIALRVPITSLTMLGLSA